MINMTARVIVAGLCTAGLFGVAAIAYRHATGAGVLRSVAGLRTRRRVRICASWDPNSAVRDRLGPCLRSGTDGFKYGGARIRGMPKER